MMNEEQEREAQVVKQQRTEEIPQAERRCDDCEHFYESWFCGYGASMCYIYGSLDIDQKVRHPDKTAKICPDFKSK